VKSIDYPDVPKGFEIAPNALTSQHGHVEPPPPKTNIGGEWVAVRYLPDWVNPDRGGGPEEQPVQKLDKFALLRPAIMPEDQLRRPTANALRFGIYPTRADGRSCTSPTFSNTRIYNFELPDGTPRQLNAAGVLSELAKTAEFVNKPVEAWIEQDLPTAGPANFTGGIKAAWEDIRHDLDWQAFLFSGLDMDEVS
jgi:hypothetical protein